MATPKDGGENRVQAIVLLTVVGPGVAGMAAGPFVPGQPYIPIVGPAAEAPPAPFRDDEPTSIHVAYRSSGTFASSAASGGVSVRPRGALGEVPIGQLALGGLERLGMPGFGRLKPPGVG